MREFHASAAWRPGIPHALGILMQNGRQSTGSLRPRPGSAAAKGPPYDKVATRWQQAAATLVGQGRLEHFLSIENAYAAEVALERA